MFKSAWRRALCAVGLLALLSGPAAAKTLYSIGNSLTNDMVPDGVAAIATDSGSVLTVGFHIRAANSLTYIAANPDDITYTRGGQWTTALPGSTWDFITLQPYYGAGSTLGSEKSAIRQFINLARSGPSSQARFCLYAAWPSQVDTGGSYAAYWQQPVSAAASQPTTLARQYFDHLYDQLSSDYRGVATICVIPVGDVLDRLDREFRAGHYPGIASVDDLYRDPNHLGDVGRFAAAATVYATLFGGHSRASAALGIYQAGLGGVSLTPELAAWIEDIVWDVVSKDARTKVVVAHGGSGSTGVGFMFIALLLGAIRARSRTRRPLAGIAALALLSLVGLSPAVASTPMPPVLTFGDSDPAGQIRAAAVEVRIPGGPHPLPLAASWATGMYPDGFDPAYQLSQINQNHRLLPWLQLPDTETAMPDAYFVAAAGQLKAMRLPITLVVTQLDSWVAKALNPGSTAGAGELPPLSPFSPVDAWYQAGLRWGRHPMLARLQQIYPDPPLVEFLSNNEQSRLTWLQVRDQGLVAKGLDDETIRRMVGDAWVVRFRELFRGFRDGLTSPTWKSKAVFVGYDAFGGVDFLRWGGWINYSLYVPGRFEPWPLAWDGASASYYTSDSSVSTDFKVLSPQVGGMNFVPMIDQAERMHANYWFELSIWDGQVEEPANGKDDYYRSLGQQYDSDRYSGYAQFGLWLTRPRVIREFRGPQQTRHHIGAYFDRIVAAVDRVHDEPTLGRFWRDGRLVANSQAQHPYQAAVPADWQGVPRWFLLDTPVNASRPWTTDTVIDVFSIAFVLGAKPQREWLVYAHAPLADQPRSVQVRIPDGPLVTVRVTRSGCFTNVRESDGQALAIGC